MKKFFELGNRYAKQSSWTDFAITKLCVCAMGVIIGINVNEKDKKRVGAAAATVFAASYIPLMGKMLKVGKEIWITRKCIQNAINNV